MPADVRSGPDRLYAEHDKGRLTRPSPQLVQCTRASLRRGSWFVDRPQKAELVGAPSVGQRIHHKVDAPNLVRTLGTRRAWRSTITPLRRRRWRTPSAAFRYSR